jgi:hypothetical protein
MFLRKSCPDASQSCCISDFISSRACHIYQLSIQNTRLGATYNIGINVNSSGGRLVVVTRCAEAIVFDLPSSVSAHPVQQD